jgi:hypothetical protein
LGIKSCRLLRTEPGDSAMNSPARRLLKRSCRKETVGDYASQPATSRQQRPCLALALAGILSMTAVDNRAVAQPVDLFQEAVNYVFTGKTDPADAPEIVDRNSCIVVMRDPKYPRYIRYYLSRFKMDTANFQKIYAGSQTLYNLEVANDDILLEYLNIDKTTVTERYRSAQIPLPGNIDQTQKALRIIFADHCKANQTKTPF